jgi:hypothetical protein
LISLSIKFIANFTLSSDNSMALSVRSINMARASGF